MSVQPTPNVMTPRVPTSSVMSMTGPAQVRALCLNIETIFSILSGTANAAIVGPFLALGGGTMTGPLDMGGHRIVNLGTPVANGDAAHKHYVDVLVGAAATSVPHPFIFAGM